MKKALQPFLGLLSTFRSPSFFDEHQLAFASKKLLVHQKSVDFADAICLWTE